MSLKDSIKTGAIFTKNYWFPVAGDNTSNPAKLRAVTPKDPQRYISPVQLQRLRHDVIMWRDAVREAEQAYYPHRVKMQRLFIDTVLNGHVSAAMTKRKNLSLLKDFCICNDDGVEDEECTKLFKKQWFYNFLNYALEAQFYGYSIIALRDLINDDFPDLECIRRWNISPDRKNITAYVYSLSGIEYESKDFFDWIVPVMTAPENGATTCGYGLLYKVALYEIFCRNLMGFNGDFVELYAQPYRVGKTTKTAESERAQLEAALRNMGSAGYALIDPQDEIEFLETALGGTGWKGYENLEKRCEAKISKIILGHADAMDSTPGKLGGGSGEESPVFQAIEDCEISDGRYLEMTVNTHLIPRLISLGFDIPTGLKWMFKNDKEREEIRQKEDEANAKTAAIILTLNQAGFKVDPKYIVDRTGIPVSEAPQNMNLPIGIRNKLAKIYGSGRAT